MRTSLHHLRVLAAALAVVLACSSCAFSGIDLIQDTRIRLVGPGNGATVELPFTVSWERKVPIGKPGQHVQYAVFVDRTVVKRGRDLRSLVPETDRQCRNNPACPDTAWLNRHDVYVVDEPEVVIRRLPLQGGDHKRETHNVSVVILVDGERQGEGSFSRTVYFKRPA